MPRQKPPFFKRIEAWIGMLGTVTALLVAFLLLTAKVEEIAKFFKHIIPHHRETIVKCSEFDVSAMSFVPYYLMNTIERGGNKSLYWVALGGKNMCKEALKLQVEIIVTNPSIATQGEKVFLRDIPPQKASDSKVYEPLNPKLSFLCDNVKEPIDIQWKITQVGNTTDIIACTRWGSPLNIQVGPNKYVYWNLKTNDGKQIEKDFILASLSAWTLEPKIKSLERIRNLLIGPIPDTDFTEDELYLQWFKHCYSQLFGSSPTQVVIRPNKRPWPPQGDEYLRSPEETIELRQANPVEAALLMGAIRNLNRNITQELRLVLFALPKSDNSQQGQKDFLLGWSCDESDWHAIDMANPNQILFEENEHSATIKLRNRLAADIQILEKLNEKGTYIDERNGIFVLDFTKASVINKIGSLRFRP